MSIKIFVSYSTEDMGHIKPILDQLKNVEDVEIFFADKTLNPGDNVEQIILNNIKEADVFLMFNSESALKSNYVQQEIGVAKSNEKAIIPILLDANKPTAMLNGINYLNFYNEAKRESEFSRLHDYIYTTIKNKNRNKLLTGIGLLAAGYLLTRSNDGDEYEDEF
ncbi:toll/interleukin-1 receptor domain-containing protein [Methanococcoides alaskense]|uniref:TIR domain-containing protein n=1 Tax=Methanococcoides alaskense TaxID=325778 RepID=A0AA90Z9H0_9EURY|nr:toll/interleukin-1 receptor domain-containing protein [Methanococcoides alaskense]MDA0525779.1 toll/interleukin-1 receptor domain-containing protein [Methanococcoides alaskense]MDR6223431.1 hypothetical protein [Methanococcoides alaskense]